MKSSLAAVALFIALTALSPVAGASDQTAAIAPADLVFEEVDGMVAVEAEHFVAQSLVERRAWHITSSKGVANIKPDDDPAHVDGASGGAYLECLPDTRATHADKLIRGENFSPEPGRMAVLHYKIHFNTPGRYYVWARAYSTCGEDNGLHVGVNGSWPETGQRLQWCVGKNSWRWESRQRTEAEHCGEPYRIYLDIGNAGEHEVTFSMREDGFEFDRFILTTRKEFERPTDAGPASRIRAGKPPSAFPPIAAPAQGSAARPSGSSAPPPLVQPRKPDGDGSVVVSGELKRWHKVTLTIDGPFAHERDNDPNPFTDYALNVTFAHESGSPRYTVPGYFAADGDAADTSAEAGTRWRAHLTPDREGKWSYTVSLVRGSHAAVGGKGQAVNPFDGKTGNFVIAPSDKTGRDFRARGRLHYVGRHHLQFAGSKEYFLKAGPDSPETLLATADFDGTVANKPKVPLKTWQPHLRDWKPGDPTWQAGRGKGLIGALNYLADTGVNAFSFLTYNAGGDGDNVWPFVERNDKLHYDCSKLDQWGIVFDHATHHGLYLHFKLQENEIDDDRRGPNREAGGVPESLDGGKLGVERTLYCRELVARFGHALAANWNIGEENTQSAEEVRAMAGYLSGIDPYHHPVVLHTFPPQQDKVYAPLLGRDSPLAGVSLQNPWDAVHQRTLHWLNRSAESGHLWVVSNDEQNPAGLGVPPDAGYEGHDGVARDGRIAKGKADAAVGDVASRPYTLHDIRKLTLWGNLMAGGAGVEYYFGYQLPQNDLLCEDFRSRETSWDHCRVALEFFEANRVPFWEMRNANKLIGNGSHDNSGYCLTKAGEVYVVYLPDGGTAELDLSGVNGDFTVSWFDPRAGGPLQKGSVKQVTAAGNVKLGLPPADPAEDWVVLVQRK